MSIDIGQGTTIAFGTSLWSCRVTSVGEFGWERKAVDTTYLASTSAESVPGRLFDNGTVPLEVQHDPANVAPNGPAETVTVTLYGGTTYTFTGYLLSYKITGITTDDLVKANVVLKVSGTITNL